MKIKLLLILFVASHLFSYGQQTDSVAADNVWDLRKCVEYALDQNLTIARSETNVRSTEIDLTQSRLTLLPSVNGSVSYGMSWGRSLNPVTYDYTTQELNSINPGLSSSVTLFNGMRIQNTIKQSSRSYYAAEQDLLKTKNDVMLNIASLYITIIFNKEQLQNANFQLTSSRAQLDRISRQVAAGAIPRSEQLNLEAQVATNETTVIQRENALNLSLLQLKQALQLPASTPFDVALIEVQVQDLLLEQNRDEIYEIARQTMPEIKSAHLKVESSDYALRAARGSLYPRVTLNGSINSNYSSASDVRRFIPDGGDPVPTGEFQTIGLVQGTNQVVVTPMFEPSGQTVNGWNERDQLKDNIFRSLSFSLIIPIFNNHQVRSGIERSKVNLELAKIAEKEVDNTLRQNVENAYNDALAASKTYNASLRVVAAREEAFRMMTQRYGAGAANTFEFQVSQNDFFQAQSDLTRAKYDFIFRKKVLDFYLGKPLEY